MEKLETLNWVQAVPAFIALSVATWLSQAGDLSRPEQIAVLGVTFSASTGLGRQVAGRRWLLAVLDVLGKGFAIAAGVLLGTLTLGGVSLVWPAMIFGACLVGALSRLDKALWWLSIQSWLFFGLSALFFDQAEAPWQLVMLVVATHILVLGFEHCVIRGLRSWSGFRRWDNVMGVDHEGAPILTMGWQAAQSGVAVALALGLALMMGLSRPYWAPMSTLFVLRPDLKATRASLVTRCVTTVLGCLAATIVVMVLPGHWVLPVLFVLTGTAAILFLPLGFPVFVALLSATIVLMVTMGNAALVENAEVRVIGTLIGGVMALLTQVVAHVLFRRAV
ncbi:FUSC family protein [Thioclava sp. GXIMD2076]|uniref:FUSC family protein n=1 Tax=Thioclava sp. GXIMD2076 TaxID=3131931 RepID=UPI0030D21BF4